MFYTASNFSVTLSCPRLCPVVGRGGKKRKGKAIMTCANKCRGVYELKLVLNVEILYIL